MGTGALARTDINGWTQLIEICEPHISYNGSCIYCGKTAMPIRRRWRHDLDPYLQVTIMDHRRGVLDAFCRFWYCVRYNNRCLVCNRLLSKADTLDPAM